MKTSVKAISDPKIKKKILLLVQSSFIAVIDLITEANIKPKLDSDLVTNAQAGY